MLKHCIIVFFISLFITPAWYLMVSEPGRLPGWLEFLSSPEPVSLSLLSQLLVVEFLIDVLKLASLNTPDSLSNSFSMLGALILGDFAVQAGWLGPEVLVYTNVCPDVVREQNTLLLLHGEISIRVISL